MPHPPPFLWFGPAAVVVQRFMLLSHGSGQLGGVGATVLDAHRKKTSTLVRSRGQESVAPKLSRLPQPPKPGRRSAVGSRLRDTLSSPLRPKDPASPSAHGASRPT